jgi:hypothetical protein
MSQPESGRMAKSGGQHLVQDEYRTPDIARRPVRSSITVGAVADGPEPRLSINGRFCVGGQLLHNPQQALCAVLRIRTWAG